MGGFPQEECGFEGMYPNRSTAKLVDVVKGIRD
jgi:hypothetical protein